MIIRYVANIRLPTEKAHGVQIMKTCEALVRKGVTLELIVPTRYNDLREDPFSYYDVKTSFSITHLPVADTVGFGMLGFLLQTYNFSRAVQKYLKKIEPALVYGRDERVLSYLAARGTNVVWETHTGVWNSPAKKLAQSAKNIVVISNGLKEKYLSLGVSKEKIIIAPDAIDIGSFVNTESKAAARARLQLPNDKKIVAYIGRLEEGKGAYTFFKAAALLPENVIAIAIGGESQQVAKLTDVYPDVRFLGSRPYRELPQNQACADIIVIPNSGKDEVSSRFTSPLKLYAALASKIPIVASEVPSIQEVLTPSLAYLCAPDDPNALAATIIEVIQHPVEAKNKAEAAFVAAQSHTWDNRANIILTGIAAQS